MDRTETILRQIIGLIDDAPSSSVLRQFACDRLEEIAGLRDRSAPDISSLSVTQNNCYSWAVNGMRRDPDGSWVLRSTVIDAAKD